MKYYETQMMVIIDTNAKVHQVTALHETEVNIKKGDSREGI